MEAAHEALVWSISWHPLGHILATGSNDHTVRFWSRNRPGDAMKDKYNLNTLPSTHEVLNSKMVFFRTANLSLCPSLH